MKVSLNIIKQFIDFDLPSTDELVSRINQQLGGTEGVTYLGVKYRDAKIVKIVECEKHPNADRLNVCKIDDGRGELVQVVCGAPNARAGIFAVWLPPESIVPSTFDDAEPFKLGARELRGVMSNGMLAAGDELAINSDHDGIIEISQNDIPLSRQSDSLESLIGASFAEVFGLDDTIIEIENKMFTHRPDLFGQLGVAREISGILGYQFTSPEWYMKLPEFAHATGLELNTFNEADENVPRIMFVAMDNISIKPSPLWLQCELVAMGGKPINNVVDVTNYIMLLTAQPTHAYDYSKLHSHTIGARMARDGEKITLLNGKEYELTTDDIVIADGEGPIGLGGIMGGGDSEVDEHTTSIVLEVATFDMYAVRKSAMRHGVFTDALTRFNKGQSPLQNDRIINLLMMSISDVASAKQASDVIDLRTETAFGAVQTTPGFINERLGLNLSSGDITSLLSNVELFTDGEIEVTPAFWRTDLELPEDIVEEVGRLYGFDKLPRELPVRSTKPAVKNPTRKLKQQLRESLKRAGANEVLTYSFVHEKVIQKAGQDVSQAFKLSNALSPDLQYYRLSVLPSLLDKVHANIRAGHDEFVLFEIGKAHNKKYHADDGAGLPKEIEMLDAVYSSKKQQPGAAYYHVRKYVERLCLDLGVVLRYRQLDDKIDAALVAPFDQPRSALIETRDGLFIGIVGELKQSVIRSFKLPAYTAVISLDIEGFLKATQEVRQNYQPLSRFPSITQDISVIVSSEIAYNTVLTHAWTVLSEKTAGMDDIRIDPVTIYQSKENHDQKTITLRVTVASHERTLVESEVTALVESVRQAIEG